MYTTVLVHCPALSLIYDYQAHFNASLYLVTWCFEEATTDPLHTGMAPPKNTSTVKLVQTDNDAGTCQNMYSTHKLVEVQGSGQNQYCTLAPKWRSKP